jgi:predicted enzyme related to lactoylglutathione lyase
MIQGLQYVILHVDDMEAARSFYTEKLGFTVELEAPGFIQFKQLGAGATFAVSKAEPGLDPIELWWFVDNADAVHTDLRAKGVQIVTPPHDEPFGRALAIKDSSGATQFLLQVAAQG